MPRICRPAIVADAELAASELVTNALEHAGGADRITLTITARMLILSVTDHGPGLRLPRLDPAAEWDIEATSGRGLLMILAFGAELAVRRGGDRTRVSARFPIGDTS